MSTIDTQTPVLLRGVEVPAAQAPMSNDFQARFGRPVVGHPSAMPCVLVLTRTADVEIDHLSLQLAAESVPLVRFDSDTCAGTALRIDPATSTITVDGARFRPRVCWTRYFTAGSVGGRREGAQDEYVRRQWAAAVPVLTSTAGARKINASAAPDRVGQLAHAAHVGLRVPASVVTTSIADAARALPGDGDLVVKPLGDHFLEPEAGSLCGLLPRRVSRSEVAEFDEPAPVLVQEHIPSSRELRVFVVAREQIAFEVRKPAIDTEWTEPERVAVAPVELGAGLTSQVRRIADRLRLDVAAFDLLDTDDGPVFLEVNEACDWRYFERRARVESVSDAVARFVHASFDRFRVYGRRP